MAQEVPGVTTAGKDLPVRVETIVVPDPGPGKAVVQVQACGLCHTDLHYKQGAAAGTYLLPISLDRLGIGMTMPIGAGVTAVGWLVSFAWAEGAQGRTLAETSALPGSQRPATADGERRVSLRSSGFGRS